MNSISVSFENGNYSARISSYNNEGPTSREVVLDDAVIDRIITAMKVHGDDSCSFSFFKESYSYGHMSLNIASPNVEGMDCDKMSPIPEDFDLSDLSFLESFICIGGEILTLERTQNNYLVENNQSFSFFKYSYGDDIRNKTDAQVENNKYKIPIVAGKKICLDTDKGKQYLK